MAKVAVFLGTRPEAIKLAPVVAELERATDLEPVVVQTGQHREMLRQVVDLFGFRVDHDLDVMTTGQSLGTLSARLMESLDALLGEHHFDFALVQGDTTTVLMASLACFYHGVALGHVEAGLRTDEPTSPFPEEMNRRLTTRLVDLHFAPTDWSRDNLLREGVDPARVAVTGNTVIDALQIELARQDETSVREDLDRQLERLRGAEWGGRPFVLITGHRRENFGAGFDSICTAVADLARRFPDHQWLYPVHLNPHVQAPVRARLDGIQNVRLLEPQPYRTFVALMRGAHVILTDSGGVQEEAPSLGKPVLVMRASTERPEGLEAGTVRLVGADGPRIVSEVARLLEDPHLYGSMSEAVNPYGDGRAAARIVRRVREFLS